MKVLVTGARDWLNLGAVRRVLGQFPAGTIIVHGGCRTGADAMADRIARSLGFEVRVYPADWDGELARTGNAGPAGPKRNAHMIASEHRPDEPITFGVAFTLDLTRNRGTRDCVKQARAVGIRMVEVAC